MVAERTMSAREEEIAAGHIKVARGAADVELNGMGSGAALALTKEARRAKERGHAALEQRDYTGATRHFSDGLKKLPGQDAGGSEAATLRCELLSSRARAWLGAGEADRALEDCGEAIRHGGSALPGPWHSRGLAHLLKNEPTEAKAHLVECARLGCTEKKSVAFLIDTCDHLARNERLRDARGPETEAHSQYFSAACRELIGDGDDDSDRGIDDVLAEMLALFQAQPASKVLLEGDRHRAVWKCLLMYFGTDSYGEEVARIFEELATGTCAVAWPAAVVGSLLATVLSLEGQEEGGPAMSERARAARLLAFATGPSAHPLVGSWSLAAPSRAVAAHLAEIRGAAAPQAAVVPLHALFSGLKAAWSNIPIDCADAFVRILLSYADRPWGAELLSSSHVRPLETLVWMFD